MKIKKQAATQDDVVVVNHTMLVRSVVETRVESNFEESLGGLKKTQWVEVKRFDAFSSMDIGKRPEPFFPDGRVIDSSNMYEHFEWDGHTMMLVQLRDSVSFVEVEYRSVTKWV